MICGGTGGGGYRMIFEHSLGAGKTGSSTDFTGAPLDLYHYNGVRVML